ncbi:hypothetical protein BH11MYX1_BH11MYX1_11630 [soil metagenome]
MTAIFIILGKFLNGIYVGRSTVASPLWAAGPVVVLVVWVYYSAKMLFFGAELTQGCTHRRVGKLDTTKNAVEVNTPVATSPAVSDHHETRCGMPRNLEHECPPSQTPPIFTLGLFARRDNIAVRFEMHRSARSALARDVQL